MPEQSLKQKTYKGFLWSFIERILTQFIQFALGIILARILFPSDYGLIGMMTIFIVISRLFIDSGLATALVQKQNRTEKDFSTVFYFNIIICLACYVFFYVAAPYISTFYHTPELTRIIRIFFISLIIDSFASIQITKLRIALDFKKKAICNLFAVVISGGVGVWMAYSGYGVWSLVMQTIINSLVTLILLTVLVRWKPLPIFSKSSFKQLFGFGSKMLGAMLIDAIIDNLYLFLIGRYFSKEKVGFYTRGVQVPSVIVVTLSTMLESVTYPVMASIQDNKEYLTGVYRRLIRMVSFLIVPAMFGLAFISEPFVRFFLTEKWMPAVILMQWLCFIRIFTPINLLNMSLLNAIGRSDLFLKMNLIRFPITIVLLIIAIPHGIEVVVISQFFMSIISFIINSYMPGKLFGYGAFAQFRDLLPAILSSAIMLAVMFAVTYPIKGDLVKMIVSIIVGSVSYLLINILFKNDGIMEIRSVLVAGYKKFKINEKLPFKK